MAFNFKSSAKSPSTPNRKGGKSSLLSQPSTTPAGPPPSYLTNKSTTPAGHPPRSSKIFGSSYNAAANTFGHRNTPGRRGRGFAVPESSPPRDEREKDEEDEMDGGVMDEGYGTQTGKYAPGVSFLESIGEMESPRGLKRSRNGQVRDAGDSGMAEIAKSFARDAGPAQLHEQDDLVLKTEEIMSTLHSTINASASVDRDEAVTSSASQLSKTWTQFASKETARGSIGPASEDALTKANYLSSLLLQLHNPHSSKPAPTTSTSRSQRMVSLSREPHSPSITLPLALLNWLNTYHIPLDDDYDQIHRFRPSPAAHESFWDLVGAELLRGKFSRVTRLLKDAGFENAITAQDDGSGRSGYHGKQLENVEEVIARFVRLIETCPAVRYDDWDIKGAEWSLFRQRVTNSIRELEAFAKGPSQPSEDEVLDQSESNIFARSANASVEGGGFGDIASASLRARSRIPWTIYENLKILHGVLLGGDEIVDYTQDWLEASLLLTVWWDGEEGPAPTASLAGRASSRRSRGIGGTREVDVSPLTAYRKRLGEMLGVVTETIEEANFKVDSLDVVQVGLCCVLEDDVGAVVELLRGWDMSFAVAVVDVAAHGGWLPRNKRGLLQQGFSSEDLMVLSHGPGQVAAESPGSVDRDSILESYAGLLAKKDIFRSSDERVEREGWELAVEILGRLDDAVAAQRKISVILEGMPLKDEGRVDKVLRLCGEMGLGEQGKGIAERYADTLSSASTSTSANTHGTALLFYARAHSLQKLKSKLSLLTSLSLIHSSSIPAPSNLDANLASLLSRDRGALIKLSNTDAEAASLLSTQISGYATLRRFYSLRDEPTIKPLERKRSAATALVAVIESASDCIRGGLFDPQVDSVVPVESLLALLGEALPLLGQEKRIFNKDQVYTLMRVVEDFATSPGHIRDSAVEVLQAALDNYRAPSPSASFSRTRSNVSSTSGSGEVLGSGSWDMLASEAMMGSDGKVIEVQRAWDWRRGLDAVVEAKVKGEQVLMLLRVALANEVARGWGGGFWW